MAPGDRGGHPAQRYGNRTGGTVRRLRKHSKTLVHSGETPKLTTVNEGGSQVRHEQSRHHVDEDDGMVVRHDALSPSHEDAGTYPVTTACLAGARTAHVRSGET